MCVKTLAERLWAARLLMCGGGLASRTEKLKGMGNWRGLSSHGRSIMEGSGDGAEIEGGLLVHGWRFGLHRRRRCGAGEARASGLTPRAGGRGSLPTCESGLKPATSIESKGNKGDSEREGAA